MRALARVWSPLFAGEGGAIAAESDRLVIKNINKALPHARGKSFDTMPPG
jgi:hypothetical protein